MEKLTIKKIEDERYQIDLSDTELINLNAIINGVATLGIMDIESYQKTVNSIIEKDVREQSYLANSTIKANNYFNEAILFLGINYKNAYELARILDPIINNM